MSRSLKKGPYIDQNLLEKLKKHKIGDKKPIKTWARESIITPEMTGFIISVHNGKEHIPVLISEDMVGFKLGEFAKTRKFLKHGGRMAREQEIEERKILPPGREIPVKETSPKSELKAEIKPETKSKPKKE